MTTTVAYHAEMNGPGRPAINVKLHVAGIDFHSAEVDAAMPDRSDAIHEAAYDRVQSDFWQAAEELADQYGLGSIVAEGRSGGWLVFQDLIDPTELYGNERRKTLDAYARYAAWVRAELDAAPGRVARLAQDIAMDSLGAAAVNQVVLA